jgi:23S rRNA (guanosine2251-2'-O)-methyltransferase
MTQEKQLIFGVHPVLEKLRASPADVSEILIAEGAARSVEAAARPLGVKISYRAREILDRLAPHQTHQGVIAKVAPFSYLSVSELFQTISTSTGSVEVLALDGLNDPRNFGALLRTAEAVGIRHVIIPKDRAVDVTPVVVKASAGAVHYLKIYKATNLRRAIGGLKDQGLWIAGLDARAKKNVYDQHLPDKVAVIIGGEGAGIRPLISRECDFLLSIPMVGTIESLNVSVAGAVFLYEMFRQKYKR